MMGTVTVTAAAPAADLAGRGPEEWLEDVRWHRRMYAQSHFRWVPEDAMHIAMQYTRGRLLFETPAHLRRLDQQVMELRGWKSEITDAIARPLVEARSRYGRAAWEDALATIGLTEYDARVIVGTAVSKRPDLNPDVRRALRGFPLPNPLTRVWELRQMESMYQGADNLLEDALCDLVVELAPRHGWGNLAALTLDRYDRQLIWRVQTQREERGELGDPRRAPRQNYQGGMRLG